MVSVLLTLFTVSCDFINISVEMTAIAVRFYSAGTRLYGAWDLCILKDNLKFSP